MEADPGKKNSRNKQSSIQCSTVTTTSPNQVLIPECSVKSEFERSQDNSEDGSYLQSCSKSSSQHQKERQVIQYVIYEISDTRRAPPKSGAERQRKYRERKRLEALSSRLADNSTKVIPSPSLCAGNQGASHNKDFYEQSAFESGSQHQSESPVTHYATNQISACRSTPVNQIASTPKVLYVHSASESCFQQERPITNYVTNKIPSCQRPPKSEAEHQRKCHENKRVDAALSTTIVTGNSSKVMTSPSMKAVNQGASTVVYVHSPSESDSPHKKSDLPVTNQISARTEGATSAVERRERKRLALATLSSRKKKTPSCKRRRPALSGAERQRKYRERKRLAALDCTSSTSS